MPFNLNINQPEPSPEEQNPKRIFFKLRYFVYLAMLVGAAYAMHQIFFMVRLTAGISNEKAVPRYFATVEIVNASGIAQVSSQVTDFINHNKLADMEILISQAERLEYRNFEKTLVISREEDTELAEQVAAVLGLKKTDVVFRPPIEKDLSPKVTLVLGEDIRQLLNPQKQTKES
jgi:hypothetical protein